NRRVAALQALAVQEERGLGSIPRLNVLTLPQGTDVMQTVRQLEASGLVEYAEPNYYRYPHADVFTFESSLSFCTHPDYGVAPTACIKPNDPISFISSGGQWYFENTNPSQLHNDVGLTAAWGLFCNSTTKPCNNPEANPSEVKRYTVAIIDDGFDLTNPDLEANFVSGTDCEGTTACIATSSMAAMATATDGSQDHGTYVASTMGAVGANGTAVAGVMWHAKILPIKTDLSDAAIINAVDYAVSHGVKVINESFGGPLPSQAEYEALQDAEQAGVLVVVSAGNSDADNDRAGAAYPANYAGKTVIFPKVDASGNPVFGATTSKPGLPNVIAVGATDQNDKLTPWSQWGSIGVGLLAPGENIPALQRGGNGNTTLVAGTSFSSPMTAGTATLLAQYLHDNGTPTSPDWHDLKEHLLNGTEQTQTGSTPIKGRSATGRLNAYLAMQPISHGVIVVRGVTITGGSGDGEINPGDSSTINVEVANIGPDETGVQGTLSYPAADGKVTGLPVGPVAAGAMVHSGSSPDIVDSTAILSFPVTFGSFSGNTSLLFQLDITPASGGSETRWFYLEAGTLTNKVAVSSKLNRDAYDDFQDWHIDVPTGAKNLLFYSTTPGEVDIDLIAERNRLPQYLETLGVFNPAGDPEFQQYIEPDAQTSGRADGDESIAYDGLSNPFDPANQPLTSAGTYHITVVNFTGRTNQPYTLTACYAAPGSDEITFDGNYEFDEANNGKISQLPTQLTLLRSGSTGAVSVSYASSDGSAYTGDGNKSATSGTNYDSLHGTVSWAAGDSSPKTIPITLINTGKIAKGASNFLHFNVALSSPTGGVKLGCIKDADVAIGNAATVIPSSTDFSSGGGGGGGGGGGSGGGKSGGGGFTDLVSLLALGFLALRRRLR
ncbi:MAG: S8 family serine peptidase, partial [Bacillota bacterium]